MRLACLFSGGKDSTFAVWYMLSQGHGVELVSVLPEPESLMFHVPNISLAPLFARAMGLPLSTVKVSHESELTALSSLLSSLKVDGVVSGALASDYQKTRIERICYSLNLRSFAPLWHVSPDAYMSTLLSADFKIIFSAVASDGLGPSWLGRSLDQSAVTDLKKLPLHLCGEGGEYETLVLDAPFFKKSLKITEAKKSWDGSSGELSVKAVLEDKP